MSSLALLFGCPASLLAVGAVWWVVSCSSEEAGASSSPPPLPGADLFADGAMHRLRIELTPDAAASLRRDPRKFVPITVAERGRVYRNVGAHLKGAVGSFRSLDDKPALTLDFSKFNPGQRFHGLRRIHLNNAVEDPSYLREELGGELFRRAGVPALRVAHARVELNGRQLGLYVLKEGVTEDFLGGYFTRVDGSLYDTDWGHDVDTRMKRLSGPTDDQGQADLGALADAARETDRDLRWARLSAVLDLDRFLTFMSVEVMLGHGDGYCMNRNNFRVYHDMDGGKIVFIPQGMDEILGSTPLPWKPQMAGLVARAILGTAEGQKQYRERFQRVLESDFRPQSLARRVDELLQALRPALEGAEFDSIRQEAALLKERISQRAEDLRKQLACPEPTLVEFRDGVACLGGWHATDGASSQKMEQGRGPDGIPALHIQAGRATSSSWRTTVLLEPGSYQFGGRARVGGVKPLPFGTAQGAGLRVSGTVRQGEKLIGDSAWKDLAVAFQVLSTNSEVELVCELRAGGGEAWFDTGSLRLWRIH